MTAGQDNGHHSQGARRAAVRKSIIVSARILVSGGLLWVLVSRIDLAHPAAIIAHTSLPSLAAALATLLAMPPVVAWRWRLILSAEMRPPTSGALLNLLLVGRFFSQVLPSAIGGDAVRAWRCRHAGIGPAIAIRSILLDRACGYLIMVALYAVSLPTLLRILPDARERCGVAAMLGFLVLGLCIAALLDRLPARLLKLRPLKPVVELSRAGRQLFARPDRAAGVLGLSLVTAGLSVLAYMLVGDSLGVFLSFRTWLLVVPAVSLLQMLPISLAGWGVREAAMVVVLAGFGVPSAAALAISVLVGLVTIVSGLPGGVIWLGNWDIPRPTPSRGPSLPGEAGGSLSSQF